MQWRSSNSINGCWLTLRSARRVEVEIHNDSMAISRQRPRVEPTRQSATGSRCATIRTALLAGPAGRGGRPVTVCSGCPVGSRVRRGRAVLCWKTSAGARGGCTHSGARIHGVGLRGHVVVHTRTNRCAGVGIRAEAHRRRRTTRCRIGLARRHVVAGALQPPAETTIPRTIARLPPAITRLSRSIDLTSSCLGARHRKCTASRQNGNADSLPRPQ